MVRKLSTMTAAAGLLASCSAAGIVNTILPDPPAYPDFASEADVLLDASRQSAALEAHIDAWLAGEGPARIPDDLLPNGMERLDMPYTLARPEDVPIERRLIVRPADYDLDHRALRGLYPDPHCTYIVAGSLLAPFGHKLVVEGEFPHARFFDIQVSPPLDPEYYYYAKQFGAPEVPIVDVDIEPEPGSVNPYRLGADRDAKDRRYRVVYEMTQGYGPDIEPAYREPLHRRPGNTRYGSAWQYQGPLAHRGVVGGHDRGVWDDGTVWIRYYAPDRGTGPLAGVPLPDVHYETPGGEAYVIVAENGHAEERLAINATHPARRAKPGDPSAAAYQGRAEGWWRENGIFHAGMTAVFTSVGKTSEADKAEGRALVKGVSAKGYDMEEPGSAMSSNSRVPYIAYLSRGMNLERGHVAVLTGRMPKHPKTLDGEARMTGGQVRYMSVTLYPEPDWFATDDFGIPHASVMDEEIETDADGRYAIVYSRPEDRPASARPGSGYTWQDWGTAGAAGFNIRWMTVHEDWRDAAIAPDASNISYGQASFFSPQFDRSILGVNGASPLMGDYLPTVHYMSAETFERIGGTLKDRDTPYWE